MAEDKEADIEYWKCNPVLQPALFVHPANQIFGNNRYTKVLLIVILDDS